MMDFLIYLACGLVPCLLIGLLARRRSRAAWDARWTAGAVK